MKYVNQLDYPDLQYINNTESTDEGKRDRGFRNSILDAGCGMCSAVMVADRLLPNCDFTLLDAIQLSYDTGSNRWGGTDFSYYAPVFAYKLGFKVEMSNDPDRLLTCLRTGGAAVINVGGDREGHTGVFSKGGHFIAAVGLREDGRVVVLDPSQKAGKYDTEGRKGKVEVDGHFCYCDISVLEEDTANRHPGYFMFWRKDK